MRISTKGRYAVRALIYLTELYNEDTNKFTTVKDISFHEDIPQRYLENILIKLKRKGFIASIKGEKGGFRLARDPRKITFFEILEVVETHIFPVHCVAEDRSCKRTSDCGVRLIWERLYENTKDFLSNITLYDASISSQEKK